MSRSYKTQKESVIAKRRIVRDTRGNPLYPRIIVRRARQGDIHPLTRQQLKSVFQNIPLKYLYGLHAIEMRARQDNRIGDPFGKYSIEDKIIILFSLPLEWQLEGAKIDSLPEFILRCQLCKAEITESERGVTIKWSDKTWLSFWYYMEIFTHELGHHYNIQYRHKKGRFGKIAHEEFVEDLHARRIISAYFKITSEEIKQGVSIDESHGKKRAVRSKGAFGGN
jgi:hypothetical protein